MASRTDKISAAQQRSIDWIKGHRAEELGALGVEVGKMLAELTVELMDAKAEAAHWKAAFEVVRAEIKVLAAVAIAQLKATKLVITRKELQEIPPNTELFIGKPEPGVRIYELRRVDLTKRQHNDRGRIVTKQ
jgi:hypothetical protein